MAKMKARKSKPKKQPVPLNSWRWSIRTEKRIRDLEEMVALQQDTIVELAKSIEGVQKTITSSVKLMETMAKRIEELSNRDTGPKSVCD